MLVKGWERDLHQLANVSVEPSLILAQERHTKLSRLAPEDGSALWTADVHRPWGWLAADAGVCAYLSQHSLLQCFDAATGAQRWAVDLSGRQGRMFGHLLVAGEIVLTGGWRGYSDLLALFVHDGTVAWKMPAGRVMTPVRGPAGTVLLPFPEQGRAWLVEASTGERVGEFPCPTRESLPDASPFVVRAGSRFICADDHGRIRAIDGSEEIARHGSGIRSFAPSVAGELLAFEDEHGCLAVYSLDTGAQLWQARIHHRRRDILPVARAGSGLAVATAFGQLLVFSPDGELVDRRTFGKHFYALAATPDGSLVGAVDGRVISVAARTT